MSNEEMPSGTKERASMLKGQLQMDGTLGEPRTFGFVSAGVIARRLLKDGSDMSLTIGLSYRNPRTHDRLYKNGDAITWLGSHTGSYTYEASYNGEDGLLHVTALSDNDLF